MKRFSHYPKKERLHPRRSTWPVVVLNGCIVAIMLGAGSVVLAGLNVSNSKADIVATRPASRASSETPKALITVAANPQSGREKEPVTATPPAPAAPSQAPLLPTTRIVKAATAATSGSAFQRTSALATAENRQFRDIDVRAGEAVGN